MLKNIEHLKPKLLPLLDEDEEEEYYFSLDLPLFCKTHPYVKIKHPDGFHHCPICKYGLYSQDILNHFEIMPPRRFN